MGEIAVGCCATMADARRRCAARHPDDLAELHRWARSAQLPAVLVQRTRIQLHFTPTSASWLTLVEVFSSIVKCQALRRGDFASVTDLIAAISRFCAAWNQRCQRFSWTKSADEILTKLNRQTTSATQH